jgi:uncharacterized protein YoxC
MMTFNLFKQLSNVAGLPPIISICALIIIFSLILFGVLISIKLRNIKKALNNLNDRLDTISQRLGRQPGEFQDIQPHKYKLGSHINNEIATDGRTSLETSNNANNAQKNGSEEHRINTEISTKIHALLKKSSKPTLYHDLTKQLSKDYPDYNYDFFLKEVEDLQKEGKVEVQLIAGKLNFQIKKT